jgi:hypothetical protein
VAGKNPSVELVAHRGAEGARRVEDPVAHAEAVVSGLGDVLCVAEVLDPDRDRPLAVGCGKAGVESLPAPVRAEIRRRSRVLQQRFTAFQVEGIAEGVTRKVDVGAIAQLGAGVFEWLPKWFDPADPRAETGLSAEYVKLFIAGLRQR